MFILLLVFPKIEMSDKMKSGGRKYKVMYLNWSMVNTESKMKNTYQKLWLINTNVNIMMESSEAGDNEVGGYSSQEDNMKLDDCYPKSCFAYGAQVKSRFSSHCFDFWFIWYHYWLK